MALIPMEHDGVFESVDNIITSTGRSSGVTVAINKLFINNEKGIGILYIQFKSSTAASTTPIQLGTLQSAYSSRLYGNRPITPLVNDTSAIPEGSIYVNIGGTTVNVYNIKANVYYIAYIPILFA